MTDAEKAFRIVFQKWFFMVVIRKFRKIFQNVITAFVAQQFDQQNIRQTVLNPAFLKFIFKHLVFSPLRKKILATIYEILAKCVYIIENQNFHSSKCELYLHFYDYFLHLFWLADTKQRLMPVVWKQDREIPVSNRDFHSFRSRISVEYSVGLGIVF